MNDLFNNATQLHTNLMHEPTQCGRLYRSLIAGEKITPLDSWKSLGIYRLSARIFDLRCSGVDIKNKLVEVSNVYGEKCKMSEYYIEEKSC